jgi:Domain of unknown function (DUF5666)
MTDSSNDEATPEAQRSRRTTWLIVAVLVVAVGVVAGLVTASLSSKSSPAATSPGSSTPNVSAPSVSTPARGAGFPDFTPPLVSGTVASVASSSFTVTTRAGSTATVKVTSSTKFSGSGITSLSSLKKGTVVAVYGTGTSPSVTATRVAAGLAGAGRGRFPGGGAFSGGRSGAFGTITTIGSDSFTVSSRSGTTETVDVSSATTYSSGSGSLSGLTALKTGEEVIVQGTTSGSVVKATAIRVFQPGAGGGFGGGGFGG